MALETCRYKITRVMTLTRSFTTATDFEIGCSDTVKGKTPPTLKVTFLTVPIHQNKKRRYMQSDSPTYSDTVRLPPVVSL